MAISTVARGGRPPVPGYTIDPEVLRRMEVFSQIVSRAKSQEGAARNALAAGFGDSYFFYFKFHLSGL
jgi:hypothetical protein